MKISGKEIIDLMGNFDNEQQTLKKWSRKGLCFSTT